MIAGGESDNKKIAFVFPYNASFIKLDLKILSESFHLTPNTYNWKNKYFVPVFILKQLFFFLFNWKKFDHIIISFGGWWCLIPIFIGKISNTKTSIILHGTDACYIPELKYGNLGKPLLKRILRYCYKNASVLLPVSESLISTNAKFANTTLPNQGIKSFFPDLETPFKVIHNGIDSISWPFIDEIRSYSKFITVLSEGQFNRKGGKLIIDTAIKCPSLNFIFVGITKEQSNFLGDIPKNVSFVGRKSPEELKTLFGTSGFYLQLSLFEGFGYALCEAMSSGCIPIVSNSNILPEIIGNTGVVIEEYDCATLAKELEMISSFPPVDSGKKASNRISEMYSIEKRKNSLISIISKYS